MARGISVIKDRYSNNFVAEFKLGYEAFDGCGSTKEQALKDLLASMKGGVADVRKAIKSISKAKGRAKP